MMRKITTGIITIVFLLVVCTSCKESGQISADEGLSETEAAESEQVAEPSTMAAVDSTDGQETVTGTGKEIEPLVSEKIDTSKQGVRMSSDMELCTEMMRGDDGSCYYYRKEGKGKKKKIVFYKDNGIKVCETKMKKSFERGGYHIVSFAKYGKKFFVVLEELYVFKTILTTVDIATGKWGKTIKDKYTYDNYIVYDNKFYCIDQGSAVTVYNLSGEKKRLKDLWTDEYSVGVQCIVDNKIYYVVRKDRDIPITRFMRCNLNGEKREELFAYGREGSDDMGCMQIDEKNIYCLFYLDNYDYNLVRIPLYGGKIEGGVAVGDYYELADDSILYINYINDYDYPDAYDYTIYRVDKDFSGKAKIVTKAYYMMNGLYSMASAPFYYGGGHLLVQDYDWKERKYVECMMGEEDGNYSLCIDAMTSYAPDWYWVTKKGKVKSTIKGTGVKKKWKEEYKKWH